MNRTLIATLCFALPGCQTTGYTDYANAMARIAEAQQQAEQRRFDAIMELAREGTEPTRMMGIMALVMGTQNGKAAQQVQPPPADPVLQWASVLLPSITTLTLGLWGYKSNKHLSDNQSDTTIAGYGAMSNIAGAGFDAVKSVAGTSTVTTNTSTVSTSTDFRIGGPGVIGGGQVILNPLPVPVEP